MSLRMVLKMVRLRAIIELLDARARREEELQSTFDLYGVKYAEEGRALDGRGEGKGEDFAQEGGECR